MGWISCLRNTRCFSCPFPLSILCTGQVHNWNEAENSMEFPEALPDLSCGVVKNSKRRRRAWRYWRKCRWVRSHGCGNRKFFDWFFLRATKLLLDFFVGFFLWVLDVFVTLFWNLENVTEEAYVRIFVERCIDYLIIFNLFLRKQNKITRGKRKTEFFEKISWNLITFVAIKTKMLKISYSEEESREFPRLQYSQSEYSHQGENFTISNSPLVAYTFFINRFSRTKRNKPLKLYRFDLLGKSVLVYGKRSFRYKVWSTHEIEFPTFQFKMVSDFSAFLRYQIGDRQNKRMFGGVFVAGISNWRRFHQCRARFELIPTFQTLLSRQLVWILFSLSLSLSVSWELLCNFVSHSFHTAAERNITREHFRNCKPPGNGEAPTILARRPTLYFFSLGLLRLCIAFIAREI